MKILNFVALAFMFSACLSPSGLKEEVQTVDVSQIIDYRHAISALRAHPGIDADFIDEGNFTSKMFYPSVVDFPMFNNSGEFPLLDGIGRNLKSGFWVLTFTGFVNDKNLTIGGEVLLFVDENSNQVIGIYPII